MNEADPKLINLDELRLVPDWLREDSPPPSRQYADHNYPMGDERGDRGERRGGGGRSGGFDRDRRGGGARPPGGGGGSASGPRRDQARSGPPARPGQDRPSGPRRDEGRREFQPPSPPPRPAPVRVEFLPDERCLASIVKQVRTTHLAYPLFGLARMFLQEPERHTVRFTVLPEAAAAGTLLYQLGEDGPITLDRAILEKMAFDQHKDQFYVERTEQKEPLKGNFTNVARSRLADTLLGPTNHHGYQPALRSLYESRFSRRMSFDDFKRSIEIITDPAVVERWKEEARTSSTIATVEGEPPTVFPSLAEARTHFREHHLPGLLRSGTTLSVHGSVAKGLPEPAMMQAIREAHDLELRYPAQFVHPLRQGLQENGLHLFKHRKRVLYVSLSRPAPFAPRGAVSPGVQAILAAITDAPMLTRKALAERVLGKAAAAPAPVPPEPLAAPTPEATVAPEALSESDAAGPDAASDSPAPAAEPATPAPAEAAKPEDPAARAKAALAADLRFLVQSGHIIEFHNGTFDLPLPPKPKEEPASSRQPAKARPGTAPAPAAKAEQPPALAPAAEVPVSEEHPIAEYADEEDEEPSAPTAEAVLENVPDATSSGHAPATEHAAAPEASIAHHGAAVEHEAAPEVPAAHQPAIEPASSPEAAPAHASAEPPAHPEP